MAFVHLQQIRAMELIIRMAHEWKVESEINFGAEFSKSTNDKNDNPAKWSRTKKVISRTAILPASTRRFVQQQALQ